MNIRIILLVSFIVEIIAETGFGFNKVIFTGFSLKNLLLLMLLAMVFTTGNKHHKLLKRERFAYTKKIHRSYLLYMVTIIFTTTLAYIFLVNPSYHMVPVVLAIKSSILDPYLIFIVFLLCPKNKQEIETTLNLLLLLIVILAGMTVLASVISPGMFFGVDNDASRPNGPFGEPNQSAAVLSMVLLLVVSPLLGKGRFSNIRLVGAIIILGCILVTGSRGGLLASALAIGFLFLSMQKHMGAGKKILIIVGGILGLMIIWVILPEHVRDMLISRLGIFESEHVDWQQASAGRTYLWAMAMEKWLESPFFGIGWMGYTSTVGNPTHNSYLEVLVSSGPLGLLFYGLVFKNILTLFSQSKLLSTSTDIVMLKGFKSAVIALLIAIFFVNLYISRLVVWAILGLMLAYGHSLRQEQAKKDANKKTTAEEMESLRGNDGNSTWN